MMNTKLEHLKMLVTLAHADVLQAFNDTFVKEPSRRIEDWETAMAGYATIQNFASPEDQDKFGSVPYPPQRVPFMIWVAQRSLNESVREAYEAYHEAVLSGVEQWIELNRPSADGAWSIEQTGLASQRRERHARCQTIRGSLCTSEQGDDRITRCHYRCRVGRTIK